MGTVLLVEDNPTLLILFTEVLKRAGYEVLKAATAEEAIQAARDHSVPLEAVVTDFSLVGTSGIALVRELQSTQPNIRAVVISGQWIYPLPQDLKLTVLNKPCLPSDLLHALRAT